MCPALQPTMTPLVYLITRSCTRPHPLADIFGPTCQSLLPTVVPAWSLHTMMWHSKREMGLNHFYILILVLDDNHEDYLVCQVYDHRFKKIIIERSSLKIVVDLPDSLCGPSVMPWSVSYMNYVESRRYTTIRLWLSQVLSGTMYGPSSYKSGTVRLFKSNQPKGTGSVKWILAPCKDRPDPKTCRPSVQRPNNPKVLSSVKLILVACRTVCTYWQTVHDTLYLTFDDTLNVVIAIDIVIANNRCNLAIDLVGADHLGAHRPSASGQSDNNN